MKPKLLGEELSKERQFRKNSNTSKLYMKFFREIRENSVYMKHEQDAGKREGRKERRGREDGEERNDRGREEGGKGREEMRGEREA